VQKITQREKEKQTSIPTQWTTNKKGMIHTPPWIELEIILLS
jgi:hypothetical protein